MQEALTVPLTEAEKKEIGENAQLAASVKGQTGDTVPFLFGFRKTDCEKLLKKLPSKSGMYTMRYNYKGNNTANTAFRVLRTDPVAGTKRGDSTELHVELTTSTIPASSVYFHAFFNSDGTIRKGVFLNKDGAVVRTVLYSYEKLVNGHILMREETYDDKEVLIDLWTIEFKGDGYRRSVSDTAERWMKQIHYKPDGSVLGEYVWDGSWTH